jgi:hypothetical protein
MLGMSARTHNFTHSQMQFCPASTTNADDASSTSNTTVILADDALPMPLII